MTVHCIRCKKSVEVDVTEEQIERVASGWLVQDAMPKLTPDERELFISGLCGTCFDDATLLDDSGIQNPGTSNEE